MRKRRKNYSKSMSQHVWRKLRRNKLAVFGMTVIGLGILVAILGANIRPDASQHAAYQIPSVQTLQPGSTVTILRIRKNQLYEQKNFFQKLGFGYQTNEYDEKAIDTNYYFDGATLHYQIYRQDEDMKVKMEEVNIADVIHPLTDQKDIQLSGNNLQFEVLEKGQQTQTIEALQQQVLDENIIDRTYWLGTDSQGRDYLSRILGGMIISLSVGFIAVIISLIIGITMGALAGYYRGWVDDVIMWLINVVWSIPTILMVISITLALGKGFVQVFIAVGLTMWVEVARIVRGQVMSVREKEFVEAGKALGFRNSRIIFRHVLPNVMGPVIVISAANFASAILIEAGLSFLGVGTQPPEPSWGYLVKDHLYYLTSDGYAFLAILPGICIIIMVLALMLIGNALRDALDSKTVDDVASV